MLSLFNGMHRADIMSEIVSGRKPFCQLLASALEMKWQRDSCPAPLTVQTASATCLASAAPFFCAAATPNVVILFA